MNISLNRVILFVRDVAGLKTFYQTYFGFPLVEEIEGEWAVLRAGQTELALHLAGVDFRKPVSGHHSNAKLVFTVDSPLTELRSKLKESGVSVDQVKRYPGFACSLCDGRDPEGNVFQLSEPD